MKKWDKRFLSLACHVATWSKDPKTQVGCVIARGKKFVSLGYNGFPAGVKDTKKRLSNRELKNKLMIHAEENAIDNADQKVKGCTVYISLLTCRECSKKLINNKVKRVVCSWTPDIKNREKDFDFKIAKKLFKEAGIELKIVK